MLYVLLESTSASQIGAYATEAEALAIVHRAMERDGRRSGETLVLIRENDDESDSVIAEGNDLIELAYGLVVA